MSRVNHFNQLHLISVSLKSYAMHNMATSRAMCCFPKAILAPHVWNL